MSLGVSLVVQVGYKVPTCHSLRLDVVLKLCCGQGGLQEDHPPVGLFWVVWCCVGDSGGRPRVCVSDPSVEKSAPLRGRGV